MLSAVAAATVPGEQGAWVTLVACYFAGAYVVGDRCGISSVVVAMAATGTRLLLWLRTASPITAQSNS